MAVTTKRLRQVCAIATVAGTFGIATSDALADATWKPPPPESYPSGWNVKSAAGPQAYDYTVGHAAVPAAPQNQMIYQMVPGGHRIAPTP